LAMTAAAPVVSAAKKRIPIGLELFSVRDELKNDLMGTIRDVGKLGYDGVEFFSPYYSWSTDQAKDVRKLLDEVGMKCFSTHNSTKSFSRDGADKAIELNQILGSRYIVMASAGKVEGLDGWKKVAELLNEGAERMKRAGIRAGYHNHQTEFRVIEGKRPIEVIAANTNKEIALQLDIGTVLEVGGDPVAWIRANPGRIKSIHCKEWSPEKGYKALFGEGKAPWKEIFAAAEKVGGVEYYLIEQEGADIPPMQTVEKCLANIRKLRGERPKKAVRSQT
ncbi:MAG TPA: sugar phosphate isomerase/epimerase, partial [Bryobacteraceae bacterium]|nr:sugar phosphate isomerase/epimerase [Bryobacteraceae bacterium]